MINILLFVSVAFFIFLGLPKDNYVFTTVAVLLNVFIFIKILFVDKGKRDIFLPSTLFLTYYYILYGFGAIQCLYLYEFDIRKLLFSYNTALILIAIGAIAFWIGYTLSSDTKVLSIFPVFKSKGISEKKSSFILQFFLLISCFAATLYVSQLGGFISYFTEYDKLRLENSNGWSFYYLIFIPLVNIGFFIWYSKYLNASKKFNIKLSLIFILILIVNFIISGTQIISFVITMIIITNFESEKISFSKLIKYLTPLISLLVLIAGYRQFTVTGEGNLVKSQSLADYFYPLVANFDHVDSLVLVVQGVTKDFDYQYGSTIFLPMLLKVLPRAVFPWKPPGTTTFFMQQFFPEALESGYNRASSLLVELYLNFGVFGVITGMLLLGILLKSLRNYILLFRDNQSCAIFYSYTVVSLFFLLRTEIQVQLPLYAAFVVPLVISLNICSEDNYNHMQK